MKILKLFIAITLLISIISLMSCNKNDYLPNEIYLIVASKKVLSEDWGGIKKERNVIREEGGQWQILFSLMPDFQHEEGYEYRLRVRKIIPSPDIMDTYTSYELISQISKEKKSTVFQSNSYKITNNAKAAGKTLTSDEIAAIEDKIKQSTPFAGVTSLTLEFMDFYVAGSFNRNFTYRTNTAKTGNGNRTLEKKDGKAIDIYTFDFDGKSVVYEYVQVGSPTSPRYLILDLTAEYKTDHPNLEVAQSGIGITPIL